MPGVLHHYLNPHNNPTRQGSYFHDVDEETGALHTSWIYSIVIHRWLQMYKIRSMNLDSQTLIMDFGKSLLNSICHLFHNSLYLHFLPGPDFTSVLTEWDFIKQCSCIVFSGTIGIKNVELESSCLDPNSDFATYLLCDLGQNNKLFCALMYCSIKWE